MAAEGRDEMDVARARQFAWRLWRPASADALAVVAASEPPPLPIETLDAYVLSDAAPAPTPEPLPNPTLEDKTREETLRTACEALADGVDRAWALHDAAQAAAATGRLARRAASLGLDLGAMGSRPLQTVRLARLAVRHFSRMPRAARTAFTEALLWLDLSHHESADLLIEVARTGNTQVAGTLQFVFHSGWDPGRARSGFVVQLAALLDDPHSTWTSRLIALDWLAMVTAREATEALRRLLTQPHLGARWRALDLLLQMESKPLKTEDVREMAFDLLEHPLPEVFSGEIRDSAEGYTSSLADAIVATRPQGGAEVMQDLIAQHDGSFHQPGDASWALRTLAGAYPEAALALVDEWLAAPQSMKRRVGVEAASRLPRDEALPRLRAAAADGAFDVSIRARDHWLTITGTPLRLDPMEGVPTQLLQGPPSEKMRSRMIVLRNGAAPARAAMTEVLYAEAPDREALALLAFILTDEDLWQRSMRRALPNTRGAWVRTLVERFGEAGIDAICTLVRPHIGSDTWIGALVEAMKAGAIPTALYPALTACALRLVSVNGLGREAMNVLQITGIPAEALDLLWRLSMQPIGVCLFEATKALQVWPADPALDERLDREATEALARRDFTHLAHLSAVAGPRKLPVACDALRAALALVEEVTRHEDYESMRSIAYWLFAHGELTEEWVMEAIQRPDLRRFAVAADRVVNVWYKDRASPFVAAAVVHLTRALASTERQGATAAEAAETLLHVEAITVKDRRLPGIVRRAPLRERAGMMRQLSFHHAPIRAIWPAIAELFTCDDPVVLKEVQDLMSTASWCNPESVWPPRARLREVLPEVTDNLLAYFIDEVFKATNRRPYWVDKE